MGIVDLELFKKHVRADDFNSDDLALQQYLDSAEEQVIMATNRTEEELLEMGGGELPAMLVQAILMIAAANYANPENTAGVQYYEVPWGATGSLSLSGSWYEGRRIDREAGVAGACMHYRPHGRGAGGIYRDMHRVG